MLFHRAALLAMLLAGTAPAAFAQTVNDKELNGPVPDEPLSPPTVRAPMPPPAPPSPPPPPRRATPISPTIEAGGFLSREFWWACDGYSPPAGRQDGVAGVRTLLATAESNRTQPALGRGVAVCDAALADPRLQPTMTTRRANLLQARAMHKAQSGDTAGALADLAESDALLGTDSYSRRSIGAATQLIRAWTQLRAGDRETAARTAREAMALRPYEPIFRDTAARIHLSATDDWPRYIADTRDLAVIDPNRLLAVFAIHTMRGEWEDAARIYPQIVLTAPRNRGGYQVQNLLGRTADQLRMRAELHGTYAYSFAARGMAEDAARELAAARAAIDEAVRPPQPIGRRTELTREQRDTHNAFVAAGADARAALDRYAALVELRGQATPDQVESGLARLREVRPGVDGTTLDLMRAFARAAPAPALSAQLEPVVAGVERIIQRTMNETREIGLDDVFEAMPEPEYQASLPAYDGGNDGFFALDHNGYRLHEGVTPGTQTVRFASTRGSIATAAEMVLLRAAELARRGGHRGLVIVARRGLIRQLIVTGPYGGGGSPQPSGQEAEVDIRFVDPANLPPELADTPWRVIDPEQVWQALQPIYVRERRAGN